VSRPASTLARLDVDRSVSIASSYRHALQRRVAAAGVPYGFTILNVSSGGVLIQTHGPPTFADGLLFLTGAVAGFTAAALLAGASGSADPMNDEIDGRWLGVSSGVVAIIGFTLAALVAHVVAGPLAFVAVALTATLTYLGVGALGVALLDNGILDRERARSARRLE
jgi:hypothetical protein